MLRLPPVLLCRPALPLDRPAMLELTSHIWDGEDYVPALWDEWQADTLGLLAVAECQGRLAGFAKLTRLAPGQWWLEGMRTHPDFEGQGVASHLTDYLLAEWQQRDGGKIRLTTSHKRIPVHRLCARRRFEKRLEIGFFRSPSLPDQPLPPGVFVPLDPDAAAAAAEEARLAPSLAFSQGLMDIGYEWLEVEPGQLHAAARLGQVYRWQPPGSPESGLLAWWLEDDDPAQPAPFVQVAASTIAALPALLNDFRCLAASLGYTQVGVTAPLHPEYLEILAATGFSRSWDGVLFVFEKSAEPVV